MTLIATRYGQMEIIDSDYTVSQALRIYGEWAQKELDLLSRFITPGACVIDAGAFIGTHTLFFSKMVGISGKVFSFEPRCELFAYLQHNINLNGLGQALGFNVALGATSTTLKIRSLDLQIADNFGGIKLISSHEMTNVTEYTVPVITLDEMELPKVALFKLDVEGMESEVLSGARKIIARDRPVIFAECNSLHDGASLLAFAQANGYQVFGSLNDAYNMNNFNMERLNNFGQAKELGLLLLSAVNMVDYQHIIEQTHLPEIKTLDNLACVLMSKPQYFDEVLEPFCTLQKLTPILPSQELSIAETAKDLCEQALSEAKSLAFSRMDEITALTARIQLEHTALEEVQQLARERLTEITELQRQISEREKDINSRERELSVAQAAQDMCEQALSEAKSLAFSRMDEIAALTARIQLEHTALEEVQQLACEQATEMMEQQRQLGERGERLKTTEQKLQVLEQSAAVRTMRRLRLLKG